MRATIDSAGRLVIPKPLRERLGLVAGEVEVSADGAALRVEPVVVTEDLEQENGRLVIPPGGPPIGDADVRALRDADQK